MATNCLQSVISMNELNGRLVLGSRLRESNAGRSNATAGALNFGRPMTLKVKANGKARASLFPSFLKKKKDRQILKEELFEAIAPLDRGAEATPDDQYQVDQAWEHNPPFGYQGRLLGLCSRNVSLGSKPQSEGFIKIARELEIVNPTKDPLRSTLLNGKWELLYTTSETILKRQRPKFLRPNGPIYQAINTDTLRAQNLETWPFFNQVTANLTPISGRRVAVKFDTFKIGGMVNIKAPEQARGELEITYLDDELRISRGDKGNLFVLQIVDPTYRVPL